MRPKMYSGISSNSSSDVGILGGSSDPKVFTSLEDESTDDITDSNSGSETAKCYSCASSFSDDSGFNSDGDVKEYISDIVLRTRCDFDSEGEKVKKVDCNSFDDGSEMVIEENCDCGTGEKMAEWTCDSSTKDETKKKRKCDCGEGEKVINRNCECDTEGEAVKKRDCDRGEGEMVKEGVCDCDTASKIMKERDCDCKGDTVQKWNDYVLKVNCECDDENKNVNRRNFVCDDKTVDRENTDHSNNINNSQLENYKMGDCSENVSLDTLPHEIKDTSSKMNSTVILHRRHRSVDLSEVCQKNNILTNQPCSRSQTPNSAKSSVASEAKTNLRTPRRRRYRPQDLNNNDSCTRHLRSFLGKAPCKLQDFFHDQGLLSLVACIIYMLILMVVYSIFRVIMKALKSFIGVENLKKIRRKIVLYRFSRMSRAQG